MSERLTKFAQQVADEEIHLLRAENARLRLTAAERAALSSAVYLCGATAGLCAVQDNANAWAGCAATLRGLLERLHCAASTNMTDNRPTPQKIGPSVAYVADYRSISTDCITPAITSGEEMT